MEIRTKKIGKITWQFVNETWETRHAWGHKTTAFRNGYEYKSHSVRYYNRTWESYTYQTCMRGTIAELKEIELQRFIDDYKWRNEIDRFKKGEKDEVIKLFQKSDIAKELKKLSKAIENKDFND